MGQTWLYGAIEGARGLISRDLGVAENRARELVGASTKPSDKALAQSLLIDIVARRGHLEAAICIYETARAEAHQKRVSKAVKTEIELQGAQVYFKMGRWPEAATALAEARRILGQAQERAKGNASYPGKRQIRRLCRLEAAGWIISGTLHLKDDPNVAYHHGQKAASISTDETIQLAALRLLSLAAAAWGNPGTLGSVLAMILKAEHRLKRRRTPPHLQIVLLRWTRALTLARAGLPEEAEELMVEAQLFLQTKGYLEDAQRAASDLTWVRKLLAKKSTNTVRNLGAPKK